MEIVASPVVAGCDGLAEFGQREAIGDGDGDARRVSLRSRVDRMRGKSVCRCGFRPSLSVAGRGLAAKANSIRASCSISRRHDVSILIGLDGRVLGVEPRSKISMTIMRPPQHGHGDECVSGSSALASASLGSSSGPSRTSGHVRFSAACGAKRTSVGEYERSLMSTPLVSGSTGPRAPLALWCEKTREKEIDHSS